jgi:hypothetical protein
MRTAGLPIEGQITVVDSLCVPMLCSYGEVLVNYWVEG